jgi:hypothetical protein
MLLMLAAIAGNAFGDLYLGWLTDYSAGFGAAEVYDGNACHTNVTPMHADGDVPTSWSTLGVQIKGNDYQAVTTVGAFVEDRSYDGCAALEVSTARWKKNIFDWHDSQGGTCPPTSGSWDYFDGYDDMSIEICDWDEDDTGTLAKLLSMDHAEESDDLPGSGLVVRPYVTKI